MTAGRLRDPLSSYRLYLHKNGKYRNAATMNYVTDADGIEKRRIFIWGEVTDDNVFVPNIRFTTMPVSERLKYIFPKDWNVTKIRALNDSALSGTPAPTETSNIFSTLLYGSGWLLNGIATNMHIIEDLMDVFENNTALVNEILSLAMFPILTKRNYDRLKSWQNSIGWLPSSHPMSASYITRLTQQIRDDHRMKFIYLRLKRQKSGNLLACDSTTRSAWGRCLADIRWGHNKDNPTLKNTLELVIYSLETHEPVYYRTFAGNESDLRTIRIVLKDLSELCNKCLHVIFDRGYESDDNINDMIINNIPFLMCGKTCNEPVLEMLYKINWDERGLPVNMEYDSESKIYYAQFEKEYTAKTQGNEPVCVTLKINLYLDMPRRSSILADIYDEIKKEKERIEEFLLQNPAPSRDAIKQFNKKQTYQKIEIRGSKITLIQNDAAITKACAMAGFFSSIAFGMEGNALEHFNAYKIRDEQEKYFESMKDQMGFKIQRNSSEDGKTGRLFILFIGLMLHCKLRAIWRDKLKEKFETALTVLDIMEPIRLSHYADGTDYTTAFTDDQVEIARAFELTPPKESLSTRQELEIKRKLLARKPGRPKGSTNKPKN